MWFWLVIAAVLVVVWFVAFVVMKVASIAIHLLLIFAVIGVLMYMVNRFRHRHAT